MKEELEVKKASVYVDSDISKESIHIATFADESYVHISLMMINENAKEESEEITMECLELFMRVLLLCKLYEKSPHFLWRY